MFTTWLRKWIRMNPHRTLRRVPHWQIKLQVETLEDRTAPALVAAYAFNEGTGTTVADSSGNGNTGTIANATWATSGKYGKALSFNGTNATVTINDAPVLHLTTAMTLEAWVDPSTVNNAWRDVIYKGNDNYYLSATSTNKQVPDVGVITNGSLVDLYGKSGISNNKWTFLAATYDGATLRLYVNGTQVSSVARTGTIQTSTNPLQIGGDFIYGQYFKGLIDEVRVYNTALTAAQITTDMNTAIGNPPPDAQPPTAPGTPTATPVSATQINLSWPASTDNVAVTGYRIERQNPGSTSFVQIGTSTGTTYSDTGLTASTTYSYRVRATDAAGNLGPYSPVVTVATPAPDTTPPVVAVTSPADGATVNGTVTITASASDTGSGVASVQFLLDGLNFGSPDTTAPYSISWDTRAASRGAHTLSAVATDGAGNPATATTVTVNVVPQLIITAPANNASLVGPTITVNYTTTGDLLGVNHPQFTLDSDPTPIPDLDFNGTLTIDNVPPGPHVLNGILVGNNRNTIDGTDATPVNFTVLASDTVPPSVTLTAPSNGATVSGTVLLTATASDNVGVVGVQFLLDGTMNIGAEQTTSPYSVSWDTTVLANGTHTLSAVARDAAANSTTSNVVTVTVSNSSNAAAVGQWSSVINWGFTAIHSVVLKTGKVLMWDGGGNFCIGATSPVVWDPATGTITHVPFPIPPGTDRDFFCSGQTVLADGRVLIVGGHNCTDPNYVGVVDTDFFDPVTQQWTVGPNLQYHLWYPTVTTLPDGRAIVISGSDVTTTSNVPYPEVYDPVANTWTTLTKAKQSMPNYPFSYVLPNGNVVVVGAEEGIIPTRVLNVATQTWSVVDPRLINGGSAVMYQPGKIVMEGSSYIPGDFTQFLGQPSAATTYVLDMTAQTPAWQQTSSMAFPRTDSNLTILPDDTVLVTGGSTDLSGIDASRAVFPAELWSPITQTWTTMASMQIPRMYHSTALLLPDGRVLSAGGKNSEWNLSWPNAEIYSPAYLFKGTRPTITSAPTNLAYNSSFFIQTPDAANIASVALICNGAVTHSVNMDQRYVPLTFTQGSGGLTVQSPLNNNTAPPGYYMLFIVDKNGVPSIAPIVHLPSPSQDTQPPSTPTNLTGAGSVATASLNWNASTDNIGPIQYNVYRSTTSGFTPSAANLIGQSTTNSYTDAGLATGTYYYVVIAQDGAGNLSGPSNQASASVTSDTVVPSVSITSPSGGQAVSGTITISANASDNVGVSSVQFFLDGTTSLGTDLTAPYTVSWNTLTVLNGNHILTAQASDASGNKTTSTSVTVNVSNTGPAGLVLALGFNAGSGTTATDSSGLGNNGTISGATWTTAGKYGDALAFNGTNSVVNVLDSSSLELKTGMTLEAWVNPTVVDGSTWRDIIYKGNDNYYLSATSQPGVVPGGGFVTGSTSVNAYASAALAPNTWVHLAVTYDGTAVILYVNGVQVASVAHTGNMSTSTNPLQIGGDNFYGQFFQGIIDEVRVYNRALSASEIQGDMNRPI